MEYKVNDNCIGCGLCAGICSNVFSLGDDGMAVATEGEINSSDEVDAENARTSCPVDAIEAV